MSLLNKLFGKEKQEKTPEEIEAERKEAELMERGRQIEFFPGSLDEYECLKRSEYEIIDTGRRIKAVSIWCGLSESSSLQKNVSLYLDKEVLLYLVNLGVEALIRAEFGSYRISGIPVKRRYENQDN